MYGGGGEEEASLEERLMIMMTITITMVSHPLQFIIAIHWLMSIGMMA
jgi:hypothetical protein